MTNQPTPDLDSLPSIECQCGRRIHIDAVHREHYADVRVERDIARDENDRLRRDYAGALLDLAAHRRAAATHEEWAVFQASRPGIHRGPWTRAEAEDWVQEVEEDGIKPGAFYVARRYVTDWEAAR